MVKPRGNGKPRKFDISQNSRRDALYDYSRGLTNDLVAITGGVAEAETFRREATVGMYCMAVEKYNRENKPK